MYSIFYSDESKRLNERGVKIIIALGHSGYKKDQEIARDCPLVDLVVGGHSHTLLYTGTPPDPKDVPSGPYPTVITQSSGKEVPVVQASAHSKYLGKLQLSVSIEELVLPLCSYLIRFIFSFFLCVQIH